MSRQIDVLLPVRNGERWIDGCLDSLLSQDADLRVLVLDDGSSDAGPQRVLDRGDPRLQLVRLEATGIVGALNHGLSLVTAPYVARMDVDDLAVPGRFARQLELLEQDPSLSLVGCCFEAVDVAGRRLSVIAPPVEDDEVRRRMHTQTPFAHGSFLFRAAAVERSGPYDPAFASAEDYDLIRRLGRVGRLASVPEVLYRWRVHPGQTSGAVKVQERDAMERVREQVWREERLAPLRRSELARRVDRARSSGPAGPAVADQLVRTELLLAAALRRRGRGREAAVVLASVAGLGPRRLAGTAADLPRRVREVRRHRRR